MFEGLERISYQPGEHIFNEGDVGDRAYLIEQGSVEVSTLWGNMFHRICILTKGELFGELALIDNLPRTATLTALEKTSVVSIPRDLIQSKLSKEDPVIEHLLRLVLKRFRYNHYRLTGTDRFSRTGNSRETDEAFSQTRDNLIKHIELASEINDALKNGEFQLYYQPIMAIETGRLVGFEALIRWLHPEKGLIPPLDFLNVAEETDQILPIGIWTMEQACTDINKLIKVQADDTGDSSLFISVNLSPRQLTKAEDAAEFTAILHRSGVDPASIKLEITETVLIEEPEIAQQILTSLQKLGFQVSLDDFGTGYSSLSYLQKFPVNTIKIDQSFVSRMRSDRNSMQIVMASVDLARALDMTIIAEGVETREDVEQLAAMKCNYAQGYHYAKPLPLSDAENFMRQWK